MARPKLVGFTLPEPIPLYMLEIAEAAELYYRERSQGSVKPEQKITFISTKLPKTSKLFQILQQMDNKTHKKIFEEKK